jgi:hypothetical protein
MRYEDMVAEPMATFGGLVHGHFTLRSIFVI